MSEENIKFKIFIMEHMDGLLHRSTGIMEPQTGPQSKVIYVYCWKVKELNKNSGLLIPIRSFNIEYLPRIWLHSLKIKIQSSLLTLKTTVDRTIALQDLKLKVHLAADLQQQI